MLGQGGLGQPNLAAIPTGGQALPFNQTDWTNTTRGRRSLVDNSFQTNPNILSNFVPFNQTDWSKSSWVPLVQPQPSLPLNINLFKNPVPFNQTDWSKSSDVLQAKTFLDQ